MPVTYSFEGRLFRLKCSGNHTPEDVKTAFVKALKDQDFPKDAALLMDMSQSESFGQRTDDEIRSVAQFPAPWIEKIGNKCAVLVTSDLFYGLSRMGAVFAEAVGIDAQVFRNVDEALEWLGVSLDSR